jgi:hypothetical protein
MQTETSAPQVLSAPHSAMGILSNPWIVLVSRSALFLAIQALIAVGLSATGATLPWLGSAGWWMFVVITANCISVYYLVRLYRAEGRRYRDAIRFSRATVKMDLIWFFVAGLIALPVAAAPVSGLAILIFGDRMAPIRMMFQSLPMWALALGLLFPLTTAFAELPTYFGYGMPHLADRLRNGWAAWLIASFFLGAQHVFLPFIPDPRFILWRLGMYMPFALLVGLLLKLRPTLLPYFMIVHALADLSVVSVYFMI